MKILIVILALCSATLNAQDFSSFDKLLKSYVIETPLAGGGIQTAFDYTKAAQNADTLKLIFSQKKILKAFNPNSINTKNEAISFWINAYNFSILATIIEKGFDKNDLIINSVKDRKDGFATFINRYKIFQREIYNIGGKKYSLDQMEKGQLLGDDFKNKGWKDARVHFAVNCASVGCPPLLNHIYEADTIDQTLTDNVKKSLKTARHFKLDSHSNSNTVYLTQLFEWYKKDFEEAEGSVKSFLKKYIDEPLVQRQLDAAEIEFIEYDWSLNKPDNFN